MLMQFFFSSGNQTANERFKPIETTDFETGNYLHEFRE